MTDTTWGIIAGALVTCTTALAAALRWAVKYTVDRFTKSKDDGTQALINAAASNATLAAKLEANTAALDRHTAALAQLTQAINDLRGDRAESAAARVRAAVGAAGGPRG